ncbi:MAG: RodZ domain-containing protein, partial [Anaerolineales bacterium]
RQEARCRAQPTGRRDETRRQEARRRIQASRSDGQEKRKPEKSHQEALRNGREKHRRTLTGVTAVEPPTESAFPSPADFQASLPSTIIGEAAETAPAEPLLASSEAPVPSQVEQGPISSQEIFRSIGDELRRRRESLGLHLNEIEQHTRIRLRHLESLESANFESLPSPIQARGMLSQYATFLDLDSEALLLRFAEALQRRRLEHLAASTEQAVPQKKSPPSRLKSFLSADILIGIPLVIGLLVIILWGLGRVMTLRSLPSPAVTLPPISDVLLETPTPAALEVPTAEATPAGPIPSPVNQTIIQPFPTAAEGVVQLVIVSLERTWMRVTVDGRIEFEGRTTAGTSYAFSGNSQIEVQTGNGAALQIYHQGQELGVLGSFGQAVDRIYTSSAVLNPTPTVTPSPTVTPTPTRTPIPSATPRPSPTPRGP